MSIIDYNGVTSKWHMIKTDKGGEKKCRVEMDLVHLDLALWPEEDWGLERVMDAEEEDFMILYQRN